VYIEVYQYIYCDILWHIRGICGGVLSCVAWGITGSTEVYIYLLGYIGAYMHTLCDFPRQSYLQRVVVRNYH
jgi:hypothetical protein